MTKAFAQHPIPHINLLVCRGCGQCEALCPTHAVERVNSKAVIVRPEACTFCDICETYCPEGAIERPFTVSFKAPRRASDSMSDTRL